jgi:hypothetical protein
MTAGTDVHHSAIKDGRLPSTPSQVCETGSHIHLQAHSPVVLPPFFPYLPAADFVIVFTFKQESL